LKVVEAADLDDGEKQMILGGTAARLFG